MWVAGAQVMLLCVLTTLYYLLMHDVRGQKTTEWGEEAEEAIIADEAPKCKCNRACNLQGLIVSRWRVPAVG